jgi:hypothetical protein
MCWRATSDRRLKPRGQLRRHVILQLTKAVADIEGINATIDELVVGNQVHE